MASDAKYAVYIYLPPPFLCLSLPFIDVLLSLILAVALVGLCVKMFGLGEGCPQWLMACRPMHKKVDSKRIAEKHAAAMSSVSEEGTKMTDTMIVWS